MQFSAFGTTVTTAIFFRPQLPFGNPPRGVGLGMLWQYTLAGMQKELSCSLQPRLGPVVASLKATKALFPLNMAYTVHGRFLATPDDPWGLLGQAWVIIW